ncbi:unnamed protein product [Choristocarpus tenellus]
MMVDHVADVYGISVGKGKPFLYTSVSRDTTIRQFTLEGIVSSLRTKAVIDRNLRRCLSSPPEAMRTDAEAFLCGSTSQTLNKELLELQSMERTSEAYQRIFAFFGAMDGVGEFWNTLRWATGELGGIDGLGLAMGAEGDVVRNGARKVPHSWKEDIPNGLMVVTERVKHRNMRIASTSLLAERLEEVTSFVIQDRRLNRSERLAKAARLHLVVGDLQRYCEAMMKLERWEHAVAVAPGVGFGYWRDLAERSTRQFSTVRGVHGERSISGEDGDSLALLLARGADEALTLAAAVSVGAYSHHHPIAAAKVEDSQKSLCPSSSSEKEEGQSSTLVQNGKGGGSLLAHGMEQRSSGREAKLLSILEGRTCRESKRQLEEAEGNSESTKQGSNEVGKLSISEEKAETKDLPKVMDNGGSWGSNSSANSNSSEGDGLKSTRGIGEMGLHRLTFHTTDVFYRESRPVLAAASILSLWNGGGFEQGNTDVTTKWNSKGTSESLAAIDLLIRGNEPEVAYAMAWTLQLPAWVISPILREMSRRAEAWGDTCLASELLRSAPIVEAENAELDEGMGSSGDERMRGVRNRTSLHGLESMATAGEEPGVRGATLLAVRASVLSESRNCGDSAAQFAKLGMRSNQSYADEAEAALGRGRDEEAVRCLVLAGCYERAVEEGLKALHNIFSQDMVPKQWLHSHEHRKQHRLLFLAALGVIRSLGSGPLFEEQFSNIQRPQVLAYASFAGGLEAEARGYVAVTAHLFLNAAACVQAAGAAPSAAATSEGGSKCRLFPVCMDRELLLMAAVRKLVGWYCSEPGGVGEDKIQPTVERGEVEARRYKTALLILGEIRDDDDLSTQNIAAIDRLLILGNSSELLGLDRNGGLAVGMTKSDIEDEKGSTGSEESQEVDSDEEGEEGKNGGRDKTTQGTLSGSMFRAWSSNKREHRRAIAGSSHGKEDQWASGREGYSGEIVVSGSRLPSARRHQRGPWRRAVAMMGGTRVVKGFGQERGGAAALLTIAGKNPHCPGLREAEYTLEDGETTMGINRAVMWAKVNPFSPLNTGHLMMPF